jgi:hypothetical protein
MRIVELSSENFKRLRLVEITPKGNVVTISGRNASGKSSVMDSIMVALGGLANAPETPIRHGAIGANIRLDLGSLVVTRSFTAKGSSLRVEDASGDKLTSPQAVLDKLMGALSFDPLEFTRLKAREQFDRLRALVDLDIDLDAITAADKADAETRTELNRDIKAFKSHIEGFGPARADLPAEKLSAASISAEIQAAHKQNALRQAVVDANGRYHEKTARLKASIAQLQQEIAEHEHEGPTVPPGPVDVDALVTKMSEIETINTAIEGRNAAAQMRANLAAAEAKHAASAKATAQREDTKREALAKAKMPVVGLGLSDGLVTFNGVPLSQSSTAEQLRVSVGIAMAANPELRVLRIMEGSLLDEAGLAMIAEMADTNDYQVWVERVSNGEAVGIVIEDGLVVGAAAEPVAAGGPDIDW